MKKHLKPPRYSVAKAEKILRSCRWPDGIVCPYCGLDEHSESQKPEPEVFRRPRYEERFGQVKNRDGMILCRDCERQFNWRNGTILEKSSIPANVWLAAMWYVANDGALNGLRLAQAIKVAPNTGKRLMDILVAAAQAAKFRYPPLPPNDKALALAAAVMQVAKDDALAAA